MDVPVSFEHWGSTEGGSRTLLKQPQQSEPQSKSAQPE